MVIPAPEGGDEPVAQGVSPGNHRRQRHKPPNGGGSTARTSNPPSRDIRPTSGAERLYPSLFPGLTPWATSVSPPSGAKDGRSVAPRIRLPTNNRDSHPRHEPFALSAFPHGSLEDEGKAAASLHALHRLTHTREAVTEWGVAEPALPASCPFLFVRCVRGCTSLWSACSEAAAFETCHGQRAAGVDSPARAESVAVSLLLPSAHGVHSFLPLA